jgi:diguanylate cyclase (GGDEF)-like protein/PAS domain S-box-containing protein
VFVFNPAAENMFGCRREEAIGQPVQKFVSDPSILEGMAEKARQTEALQEEPPLSQPRVSQGIRCNGEEFPIEISLSAFITLDSLVFSAIIRDITDRKRVEDELRHLSTHDGLTGLYNRFYFQAEMDRLDKGREEIISVVIADMDGLKYVNDNYGHAAGDEMIKTVARAIQKAFRLGDVIARLGGDEFGVLLPGADSMTTSLAIHRIYENIRHSNEQRPYLQIGISIGYATTQEYESLAETIKRADAQMYYQKNRRTSPPRQ